MTGLKTNYEWSSYDDVQTEVGETSAHLSIYFDSVCLTKNEDAWSRTIKDKVYVSLYPLAMWLASSWWRLHYEILPDSGRKAPSHDWRMSHEMSAANMGFVWPNMVFSADSDYIQIWAQESEGSIEQSVRFLRGLDYPRSISKKDFTREISSIIEGVLARLHYVGCSNSELRTLWSFISEDLKDPAEFRKRRLEAELGFDPESCPNDLLSKAIDLDEMIGETSFSELSGAYAEHASDRLEAMHKLVHSEGLQGRPDESSLDLSMASSGREPWQVAVSAARQLRDKLGDTGSPLKNDALLGLLGLTEAELTEWRPQGRQRASIAGTVDGNKLKIIPRKRHPIAQRFEVARFIGDYANMKKSDPDSWLVTADLSTARQKYQRAFAAELLCPIESLTEFLDDDFSETALEDAAVHFSVSDATVDALLMNNGFIPRHAPESSMPYRLAV